MAGRQTGSVEWRAARGELGAANPEAAVQLHEAAAQLHEAAASLQPAETTRAKQEASMVSSTDTDNAEDVSKAAGGNTGAHEEVLKALRTGLIMSPRPSHLAEMTNSTAPGGAVASAAAASARAKPPSAAKPAVSTVQNDCT